MNELKAKLEKINQCNLYFKKEGKMIYARQLI